jgi:hypothetical protein
LFTHLWTGGGSAPKEWTDVLLYRDIYHCTPSQLEEQDLGTMRVHLALLDAEARAEAAKRGESVTSGTRGKSALDELREKFGVPVGVKRAH